MYSTLNLKVSLPSHSQPLAPPQPLPFQLETCQTVKTWQIFVHVIEMCDCCSKCIRLLANTIVSQQADAIVPFLQ